MLGRNPSVGVLDDLSDLLPIVRSRPRAVEEDAHPVGEDPASGCRRAKESLGVGAHELSLSAGWRRTPQRDPTVAVVVVMEVAEGPPAAHKEARFTVTTALGPFR